LGVQEVKHPSAQGFIIWRRWWPGLNLRSVADR